MGGVWGQIWSQCLRMGEQLDRGAATLPTLSSLSRINDGVRLRACVEPTRTCTCSRPLTHTHTHTRPSVSDLHRHPRPQRAAFILDNVKGRVDCFWFSNKRAACEWEEARVSLISPSLQPAQPSLPCHHRV